MKKLVFKVELILAEDCPNEFPFSKETYANMITDCIRNESSEKEVIDIKSEVIDFEGVFLSSEYEKENI